MTKDIKNMTEDIKNMTEDMTEDIKDMKKIIKINDINLSNKLKKIFYKYNNYELVLENNHVYTLYSDGELTSQKGGRLYKQRTEHIIKYGFNKNLDPNLFPIKTIDNNFGYIIIAENNINIVRNEIKELIEKN